jgi:hypothetical protein
VSHCFIDAISPLCESWILLAHRDQLRRLGIGGDHRDHQERLTVMMNHALHEFHVAVREVVVVKRGDAGNDR